MAVCRAEGVPFDGLGGVGEGFGDDLGARSWPFLQRAEACGSGRGEFAESVAQAGGVHRFAGGAAREDPVAVGVGCGIGRCCLGSHVADDLGQGVRQHDRGAEVDDDEVVVDADVLPGQSRDSFDGLAEGEDEDGGEPVPCRDLHVAGGQVEGVPLGGDVQRGGGSPAVGSDFEIGGDFAGALRPAEESADEQSGARPFGLPLIELGLGQGGKGLVVLDVEPGEEVDRDGDVLLGA